MWVFTKQGFYSVVAHPNDPDRLLVRARRREDLQALRAQIPNLRIFGNSSAEFRWYSRVTRAEWVMAAALLSDGVDYGSFDWERSRGIGDPLADAAMEDGCSE